MDLYFCGHGGWDTRGHSSVFVEVPAGTEVVFYKEVGYPLTVGEARKILEHDSQALRPVRTIRGPMQAPEMTLYPAQEFWPVFGAAAKVGHADWHAVATETRLGALLQRYRSARIHWIACSVRELAPTHA